MANFYMQFIDQAGNTVIRPTDDMYDAATKAVGLAMAFHVDVHILDKNKTYMYTVTTTPAILPVIVR